MIENRLSLTRNKALSLSIIALLILFGISMPAAFASGGKLKITLDQSSCTSYLAGKWTGLYSLCDMQANFTINSSVILTVPSGTYLHLDYTFKNYGTIIDQGDVFNDGGEYNYGTITNIGSFGNGDTLNNYGLISGPGAFGNGVNFDNKGNGTLVITKPGSFTNSNGAKLSNDYGGVITFKAGTTFENSYSGEVLNSGVIDNYGTMINDDYDSSTYGLIDNFWVMTNEPGGLLDNVGTISNSGTMTSYGTIDNSGSASFIDNAGSFFNYGTVDSFGGIFNQGTLIDECKGQVIDESGSSYTGTSPVSQPVCSPTPISVSAKFKPNSFTVSPSSSLTVKGSLINTGSSTFYITGCKISYKLSTASSWKTLKCTTTSMVSFPNIAIPISVKLTFSSGIAAGTYDYKVIYFGTANGIPSESQGGKITVTVA